MRISEDLRKCVVFFGYPDTNFEIDVGHVEDAPVFQSGKNRTFERKNGVMPGQRWAMKTSAPTAFNSLN